MQTNPRPGLFALIAVFACLVGVPSQAQTFRALTDSHFPRMSHSATLADGSAVLTIVNEDPVGTNPQRAFQVFSFDVDSGAATQVTHFDRGVEYLLQGVSVSEDGSLIAFASRADPVGTNPDGSPEVFVMHPDGSGVVQVTDSAPPDVRPIYALALAGGGARVAYVSSAGLFRANVDGSDTTQILPYIVWSLGVDSAGERLVWGSEPLDLRVSGGVSQYDDVAGVRTVSVRADHARLSANGARIAHRYKGPSGHSPVQLHVRDWDGNLVAQGDSQQPGFSGDGVYLYSTPLVVNATGICPGDSVSWGGGGSSGLLVPPPSPPAFVAFDGISGSYDGQQVSMTRRLRNNQGDNYLDLLTASIGGEPTELLRLPLGRAPSYADIAHDGSLIAFTLGTVHNASTLDTGTDLYVVRPDGRGLERIFEGLGYYPQPMISPNGQTVYFPSAANELLAIDSDGTNLRTIVNSGVSRGQPRLSADGSVLVYAASGNVYASGPEGQSPVNLGPGTDPRIDGTGTWVVFESGGSIYRTRANGATAPQAIFLGSDVFESSSPDISLDGSSVVYLVDSSALRRYDTMSGLHTELIPRSNAKANPRISPDGSWIYYMADVEPGEREVYRVRVATGEIQRFSGLGGGKREDARASLFTLFGGFTVPPAIALDAAGRVVYVATGDLDGGNPGAWSQVWIADAYANNPLVVSGPAPTRLDWGVTPWGSPYDVVRGDLDQLRLGPGLGDVVCLRDDSPEPTTQGSEDLEDPASGQGHFYLYRGDQGPGSGTGSYGRTSAGAERLANLGDCDL